ncbi:hypothetical protein ASD15_29075 [Massilia sp. Root351]|uniref:hypothetical protein n=1 Tax=Massilia sp. Root351 TaxID=1736522 RepID=UPI000709F84A|nr:hypothetical protein [Massilia sp. Root351]KQV86645.1 hypothetical protein ASD15_29075 [Massilia sp. Root351]
MSESDYHLYKNACGLTQYATTAEAQAMQLQAAGYSDLGARFSTTAHNAFSFDADGYLLANKTSTAVQHLVLSLAAQYGSTSDAGFIDAVEQDYLAQVQLVGTVHAGSATAADLNAAFGTSFA